MNLVDELLDALARAEALTGGERDHVEPLIAGYFLNLTFGSNWYDKYIHLTDNPDRWMFNGNDAWLSRNPVSPDMRRFVYGHRITRLADAFFTLLSNQLTGGEVLRQRILHRPDTRAWFIETEIASLLVYNGCAVSVVEESGSRGQDFDLLVGAAGAEVSVEVTTMEDAPLTTQALLNKLHGKRDQVPKHRPAILYLHVPVAWMKDGELAPRTFTQAIQRFFERSARFNAIILVAEEVLPLWGGAMPSLGMKAAYHNRPRHPIPDMSPFELRPDERGEVRLSKSLLERLITERTKRGALIRG